MEAELEMCFTRKVKTYCETKPIQQDAAVAEVTSATLPTLAQEPEEKSNCLLLAFTLTC